MIVLKVGDRVKLGFWPFWEGVVTEIGADAVVTKYRVHYDNGEKSGWLNASELEVINGSD